MIIYLLKSLLFSGLFLLAYYLFLEKEKTHRFNRFYLLFALLFSVAGPLFSIQTYSPTLAPVAENYLIIENNISKADAFSQPIKNTTSPFSFLLLLYGSISLFLFFRLLYILYGFDQMVRKNQVIKASGSTLVLLDKPVSPHTFLHYIFLSKDEYSRQAIEPEIIGHESTHVKQKHSLDILLLELIQVFIWINPLLLLYRKAIQLNHEYLADDAVIKQKEDISTYQYLLLNKTAHTSTGLLPSHFNFMIIKKRLTMMTKTTSRKKALLIQWAVAPLVTAIALSLCLKTVAQDSAFKSAPHLQIKEFTVDGASPELMKEFDIILKRHKTINKSGHEVFAGFENEDRKRLEEIYKVMNREQQKNSVIKFVPRGKPFSKVVPTAKQLEDFGNPKNYGVWIDNKKVGNNVLKNYQASDFSHVFISRLYGYARSNVTYNFQVNLMTNSHYQQYLRDESKRTGYVMMITFSDPPKKKQ
jgi:bla regulator protein blaR1